MIAITDRGLQLLYDFEVGGGQKYYEKYLIHPNVPGYDSGITIGIGYDLGYCSQDQFFQDWSNELDQYDLLRVKPVCHFIQDQAKRLLDNVKDIEISWGSAVRVFIGKTIPAEWNLTLNTFPGAENLPPDCQAVLLSLVFNRGPRLTDNKPDDRLEMRNIRKHLEKGNANRIPDELRSMKRLWKDDPNSDGDLADRREAEAALFESAILGR